MVRSLLARGNISKNFWPEAVNWSIRVLNRSPTFSVQNRTPEEAWSGRKPAVDYFRIFGCIAYAHVPDEKRKKLDDKGEKCVFLGISECSKAYKLFNPLTKKIVTSRDVVFDEENTWDWNRQQPTQVVFDTDSESEPTPVPIMPNNSSEATPTTAEILPTTATVTATRSLPTPTAAYILPTATKAIIAATPSHLCIRKRLAWMEDYKVTGIEDPITHFALFSDCDPTVFEDAVKNSKWQKAMDDEIAAIERNNTWELTDIPKGHKTIGVNWVYKTTLKENGEVDKYKARLVAKGYKQEFGIDYKEVFALVARLDTIRLVLSIAAQNSWPVYQLDVKSTFLHGGLKEEVYIDQPLGYMKQGHENQVYKLKKALYGLKQAPRAWYSRIDEYFAKEGFLKCPYEHTFYIKAGANGKILIVCLYVDDLIYVSNDGVMLADFKTSMMNEFDMSDLGLMHYVLGIEVVQSSAGIFISQKKYVLEILDRFHMKDCNPVLTPSEPGLKLTRFGTGEKMNSTLYKQIVGSLMYLTSTRLDIIMLLV
jgi:hypothetical protein